MTNGSNMAGLARIAAAGLALLLAAAPAAAAPGDQRRAVMAVSAIVAPSCQVAHRAEAGSAVACSSGTRVSTLTAASGEKPLNDAAAILGAPARGPRGIEFSAPVRAASADTGKGDDAATRYLTITY